MNLAFNTFVLPFLGFLFLPFATLMYVWLMQGVGRDGGVPVTFDHPGEPPGHSSVVCSSASSSM
jgi:hypothetical protein